MNWGTNSLLRQRRTERVLLIILAAVIHLRWAIALGTQRATLTAGT